VMIVEDIVKQFAKDLQFGAFDRAIWQDQAWKIRDTPQFSLVAALRSLVLVPVSAERHSGHSPILYRLENWRVLRITLSADKGSIWHPPLSYLIV
jgi:hypothetical protein